MIANAILFLRTGLCIVALLALTPTNVACAADLSYPDDCDSKTLRKEAQKSGCTIEAGGSHWKVYKDDNLITTIPHTVKENGTCRAIIKAINTNCDD
jgi:hypothetical protein